MKWIVETSHMVSVPPFIEARTVKELHRKVQGIADQKKVRVDRPPIGKVKLFRGDDFPEVIRFFFIDKHGKHRRFMRVRQDKGD